MCPGNLTVTVLLSISPPMGWENSAGSWSWVPSSAQKQKVLDVGIHFPQASDVPVTPKVVALLKQFLWVKLLPYGEQKALGMFLNGCFSSPWFRGRRTLLWLSPWAGGGAPEGNHGSVEAPHSVPLEIRPLQLFAHRASRNSSFRVEVLQPRSLLLQNPLLLSFQPFCIPLSLQWLQWQLALWDQSAVGYRNCLFSGRSACVLWWGQERWCFSSLPIRPPTRSLFVSSSIKIN